MKRLLMILFLSGNVLCSYTQEFSTQFGQIGHPEKYMLSYDKDKEAEAVVLFDKGFSRFIEPLLGFQIEFKRQTRIKILSESALEWAEVEIPLYRGKGNYESVKGIVAVTFNVENGAVSTTALEETDIFEEKINDYWVVKKFTMPNVKKGSIIDYTYTVTSESVFSLPDWDFQWEIPVLYSRYEIRQIPFYDYMSLMQGDMQFSEKRSYVDRSQKHEFAGVTYHEMVCVFEKKDIPAFYDEAYITSSDDYITKLEFQLAKINPPTGQSKEILSTWEIMKSKYLKSENAGKYVKKSAKSASKLMDMPALLLLPELERFDAVMEFVKANYSWNKYNGKYAARTVKEFNKEKIGDAAELNLFSIGLMQALELDAYPVISSTRSHGKVKLDYPFNDFFNYVLIGVNIDGQSILSDATDPLLDNQSIPMACINDKGLVMKEGPDPQWLSLATTKASVLREEIQIDFEDEYTQNVTCNVFAKDYYASSFRSKYGNHTEHIIDHLKDEGYNCKSSDVEIKNYNEKYKPYELTFTFHPEVEKVNDKIYISPFFVECDQTIPFKQRTRTYPIDFTYPRLKEFSSVINVPEGYTVDFLPEKRTISNALFELRYEPIIHENDVEVQFSYHFKKAVYSARDYSKIKFFFKEIVKKGNEKVVLVKGESIIAEK